jgi:predicted GIY-YIG superfamily endonuclease
MACAYRLYDSTDRLLYAGAADDFDRRWRDHEKKSWWRDVARKEVIWFDNRLDALYEESRTIALERPVHNRREGISPVGLRLFRLDRRGQAESFDGALAATRSDKNQAMDAVQRLGAHGWLTFEGEQRALVVPVDWYLEAQRRMGELADLTGRPTIAWEET